MAEPNHARSPVLVIVALVVVALLVVFVLGVLGLGLPGLDGEEEVAVDAIETTGSTGTDAPATTRSTTSNPGGAGLPDREAVVEYRIDVVATHPHDTGASTQGLEMVDGVLLESTGLRGASTLRLVEPTTGEPIRTVPLDDDLYGEGATVVGQRVWQLTWTSGIAIAYDLDDLTERRRVTYEGEGWGLCAMADRLVMSNGSSLLTTRDPETFEVIDRFEVTDGGAPVPKLNELECLDGVVWANLYQSTRLVAIDAEDGRVIGSADLADLVPPGFENDRSDVANGIAHDPSTGRFWLAGKRWPVLYEVELVALSPSSP